MEQYIFESQVLSNTFEKRGTIPVERFQQCIVLIAQPLIGVAHHLCRDERLTVEKPLVVPDDLCLDVVEREVGGNGFLALALLSLTSHSSFGTVRLQLNYATVPLIVTRPMMGTIPFFSLLPFT